MWDQNSLLEEIGNNAATVGKFARRNYVLAWIVALMSVFASLASIILTASDF